MHRGAYEDNIKHAISPSDNTGFMAWDEAGGRIELRIRFGGINNSDIKDVEISHFKETSSSHPEQTTFSDKD